MPLILKSGKLFEKGEMLLCQPSAVVKKPIQSKSDTSGMDQRGERKNKYQMKSDEKLIDGKSGMMIVDSSLLHEYASREELCSRIQRLMEAGEKASLEGADWKLAITLFNMHPILKKYTSGTAEAITSIRFGVHERFPKDKCFLVSVTACDKEGKSVSKLLPCGMKKVIDKIFPRKQDATKSQCSVRKLLLSRAKVENR